MVLLLWTPDDNVAAIFARMAIATQIMVLRPIIIPYNLLVVQFGGIVVISIVMNVK
jgi:hypothetical protein